MDDPLGVGVLETHADLMDEREREVHRELFPLVEDLPEALALDELHHHHVGPVLDAEIDDLHDVLVIERRGRLGLEDEAPREILVGGEMVVELLDGDDAVQRRLHRPVQHRGSAGRDELDDLIVLAASATSRSPRQHQAFGQVGGKSLGEDLVLTRGDVVRDAQELDRPALLVEHTTHASGLLSRGCPALPTLMK